MKFPLLVLVGLIGAANVGAQKRTAPELIELSKSHSPELRAAIEASFDAKDLKEGTAWTGRGPDFFFAVEAGSAPTLMVDDAAGLTMTQLPDTQIWYASAHIVPVGRLHAFHYLVSGARFGGKLDLPAFSPLSYLEPGVPSGKLSDKIIHTSKIYDGMTSEYWIYVPAQYDAKTPAAVMVFQDGGGYIDRNGNNPTIRACRCSRSSMYFARTSCRSGSTPTRWCNRPSYSSMNRPPAWPI